MNAVFMSLALHKNPSPRYQGEWFRSIGLVILLTMPGCSDTPNKLTAPTPPDVSGDWRGTFVIANCPNYPNCGFITYAKPPETPFEVELTLAQDGEKLTGTLQRNPWNWVPATVSGTYIDGVVHLSGRSKWERMGFCGHSGEFVLHDLEARVDHTRTLSGRLSFTGFKTLSSCYAA